MENLTHSLVGASLAELALPSGASTSQRRLFYITGIVAANLPDADLVFGELLPRPLGYLLLHRGHTHTLGGLVVQALLIGLVCLIPALRRLIEPWKVRFRVLVGAALASHVVLDSWNSYGVHPFWPLGVSWYYGDAISIFEPWLWVILGVCVALNTRHDRGRLALLVLPLVLVVAIAWFQMIPVVAAGILLVAAALWWSFTRKLDPDLRAMAGLSATALFVMVSMGLSSVARAASIVSFPRAPSSSIVDIIRSPFPANPMCWSVIVISKHERADEYEMRRGTASLIPRAGCGDASSTAVHWEEPVRFSLSRLRSMARDECTVRQWLQFARAPWFDETFVSDYRFGGGSHSGFTAMPIHSTAACPAPLSRWAMPRADLLEGDAHR